MTSILLYRPHEGEEEHQGQHSRSGRNAERAVLLFSASGKGRSLKNREIKKYMALFSIAKMFRRDGFYLIRRIDFAI